MKNLIYLFTVLIVGVFAINSIHATEVKGQRKENVYRFSTGKPAGKCKNCIYIESSDPAKEGAKDVGIVFSDNVMFLCDFNKKICYEKNISNKQHAVFSKIADWTNTGQATDARRFWPDGSGPSASSDFWDFYSCLEDQINTAYNGVEIPACD